MARTKFEPNNPMPKNAFMMMFFAKIGDFGKTMVKDR
jgi:hypothetical protein